MLKCSTCGYENIASSRFCRQCGNALKNTNNSESASDKQPRKEAKPSSQAPSQKKQAPTESPSSAALSDDELQTQLLASGHEAADGESDTMEESSAPTQPLKLPEERGDDGALQPGAQVGEYEIVDLHDEHDGQRTYRAQAPADVCAQCGTRAADSDAHFCEECGAELQVRDVLLVELPVDTERQHGPARLMDLPDEPLRKLLPPVTAFTANDRTYLVIEAQVPGYQSLAGLLADQGEAPQAPAALDEKDALPIALQLAQLIQYLHHNGTALGNLSLAQLLIGPQRRLRLRDVDEMHALNDERRAQDLQQLVHTLEDLTRLPRETRKLSTEPLDIETPHPNTLEDVLALGRSGLLSDADSWVEALQSVVAAKQGIRSLSTHVGAHTDIGVQRELDEDALMTQELRIALAGAYVNAGIYVVADGMGGHAAGEVASTLAVQAAANTMAQQLVELASSTQAIDDERLKEIVGQAVEKANLAVYEESRRRNNDMGTTITLAVVVGDRCMIGNVGDSRTYLLRDKKLQRISQDHSLVMRLVAIGQITEEEIYTHPHRNAILRSLGERPDVEVDTFPLRLQPGDALFLCSDGQWEMVHDPRLNEVLISVADPQAACEQLVDEANANGGEDNITAVLVRFDA